MDADKVVSVYHYSCDRYGEKGAGCWVTATLGLRGADGEPAGAAEVVAEVRKVVITSYSIHYTKLYESSPS